MAGEEAFYWKNFDPEEMKNVFEEGMNLFSRDPDKKD
ncbi:MAG TPA: glycosyltransferase family 1 protein, partial [Deltaproteobacteria bacterium]|nr:glycosyltransferase family 1 protein [Deltaproteobacteria bacterium]